VAHRATIGGARALGLDAEIGSLTVGKNADVVLIKNDESPALHPLLRPCGTLVFQAGRGDVHTFLVGGRAVKHAHRLREMDLAAAKDAVSR
jgi:cytosine/adenosine deaminase-related metal-dependent hydrolase